MKSLPREVVDRAVSGVGLSPGNFGDQLDDGVTLIVFLRHFGCMFCREAISDLREAAEANSGFPDVLFLVQASPTEARAFLRRYWPGARAVADPSLEFYEEFGVRRGGVMEAIGPRVLASSPRALAKGHRNGPRSGDPWRMPGVFAVRNESVIWCHRARHAADHPDFARIPEWIEAAETPSGASPPNPIKAVDGLRRANLEGV
jgi:AhpC/TSA antioxidant enzyme